MKILLTGGGTGGHFYPIVAIIDEIYKIAEQKRLLVPKIIFASNSKYDPDILKSKDVIFRKIPSGKMRRYFSVFNFIDIPKIILGILKAMWLVYSEMPDIIFGKGGYASFPILLAAKIFRVPVIIHESDAIPGKVNKWAGKFAARIAVSFSSASGYFPKEKTALTGTPVRKTILGHTPEEATEIFKLEPNLPTILVIGGSQGAQKINDILADTSFELVKKYQVIHQCGKNNIKEAEGRIKVILEKSLFKNRYHIFPYLDDSLLRNASSVANLVISRAGGTAIYEIAGWSIPSIMIPIKNSAQDHQRANAYNYNRTGAAEVIEETNLTPHILLSEIERILKDEEKSKKMKEAAKNFSKPEAAQKIAEEIINIALSHA